MEHTVKEIPYWITVLSALLTPTIAIIAVVVGIWQSKINQRKLRLELFNRRIKIFHKIGAYISGILQSAQIENPELTKFLQDTRDVLFVFGEDIRNYVDEIYKKSVDLHATIAVSDTLRDDEREKNADRQAEQFDYFKKEMVSLQNKFEKYLRLEG